MQEVKTPQKNIEITDDLYKMKREAQIRSQMQTFQSNTMEFKNLQDELNDVILNQNAWGHNNNALPNLMKTSMSQKTMKTGF